MSYDKSNDLFLIANNNCCKICIYGNPISLLYMFLMEDSEYWFSIGACGVCQNHYIFQ